LSCRDARNASAQREAVRRFCNFELGRDSGIFYRNAATRRLRVEQLRERAQRISFVRPFSAPDLTALQINRIVWHEASFEFSAYGTVLSKYRAPQNSAESLHLSDRNTSPRATVAASDANLARLVCTLGGDNGVTGGERRRL
jgi:hypothetical protein